MSEQSSDQRVKLRTVGTETVASYAFEPPSKRRMPPELMAYITDAAQPDALEASELTLDR